MRNNNALGRPRDHAPHRLGHAQAIPEKYHTQIKRHFASGRPAPERREGKRKWGAGDFSLDLK
jgi:hypothetical protein